MARSSIRWAGTATPRRRFPIRYRRRSFSRGPSRRCGLATSCASPASTRFPIRPIGKAIAASASARRSRCRWRSPAGRSAPWDSTRFDGSAPGRRTSCTCSACSPRPSATCWPAARATRPCARPSTRWCGCAISCRRRTSTCGPKSATGQASARSSGRAWRSARRSSWSIRCRPPIRQCCWSARPAPARSCSHRGSTISAIGTHGPWCE